MKAGRELDALVAEKVMDLNISRENPWDEDDDSQEDWYIVDANGNYKPSRPVPPYSTDIAAAWEVVERVKTGLPSISFNHVDKTWTISLLMSLQERRGFGEIWCGPGVTVVGPSVPEAICLAALKAVGA